MLLYKLKKLIVAILPPVIFNLGQIFLYLLLNNCTTWFHMCTMNPGYFVCLIRLELLSVCPPLGGYGWNFRRKSLWCCPHGVLLKGDRNESETLGKGASIVGKTWILSPKSDIFETNLRFGKRVRGQYSFRWASGGSCIYERLVG